MSTDWGQASILVGALVPSVILHEVSHGAVANFFGDDTAKRAGRLTLNPIAHIDPFGTVILPAILSLSGVGAFGYAKPVPVNPRQLRNPKQHSLYVSLAGPATNIALVLLSFLLLRTVFHDELRRAFFISDLPLVPRYVFWLGFANIILAVFNLIPIPPLDGSALIERVLPNRWWPTWLKVRQWGFGILLLLVILLNQQQDSPFDSAFRRWIRAL